MKPIQFINETKNELKKVVWPKKDKVVSDTVTVIALSLVIALFLGFLDILFSFGLEKII